MSYLFWPTEEQPDRLRPLFLQSHGRRGVDDRHVLSGFILFNDNGLRWRDAPAACGPYMTLENRWKRWSEMGVFARMLKGLAAETSETTTIMIGATYLKAHRTASSLRVKKGGAVA